MADQSSDALFDETRVFVVSGDGGNGVVSFRREKFVPFGGPNGGNGGRGGSIFLEASAAINTLIGFRRRRHFSAGNGAHGSGKDKRGADGEDTVVQVPLGTLIYDDGSDGLLADLVVAGQRVEVAHGGRGGRGNATFVTATNQAPRIAERGDPGETRTLRLELRLIADVGLVGMPNAGKSTLLSVVSAARPKIADYPFTTLQPNLGVVEVGRDFSFVMADLPGLIEGAHDGTGLGHRFLRHVERTRVLVHLVDGSGVDPCDNYRQIRRELELYDPDLALKPEIAVISKIDIPEVRESLPKMQTELAREADQVLAIAAVTGEGVPALLTALRQLLEELPVPDPVEVLPEVRPAAVDDSEAAVRVFRRADGAWVLRSPWLERLAWRTAWEMPDAVERFRRILERRGVTQTLAEMGARQGDTVIIGEAELEWDE